MAGTTSFPSAIDSFPDIGPATQENESGKEHDVVHENVHAAILAAQVKIGIDESDDPESLDARVAALEDAATVTFIRDVTTAAGGVMSTTFDTFRMPHVFTLTAVRASVAEPSTIGDVEIDILNEGVSIFGGGRLVIDEGELTSRLSVSQPEIVAPGFDDDELVDIEVLSEGVGAAGLRVYLTGVKEYTPATIEARYWRISISRTVGGNGYVAIGEVSMSATPGGADQATTGGASASGSYSGAYSADKAFDDNLSTNWSSSYLGGSNGSYGHWIMQDFGSATKVAEVAITSAPSSYGGGSYQEEDPCDFEIQYSNDGVTWATAKAIDGQVGWSRSETRVFATD